MNIGKLGVWYFFDGLPATAAAEAARRIEELGYGTLWIPETVGKHPLTVLNSVHGPRFKCPSPIGNIQLAVLILSETAQAVQLGRCRGPFFTVPAASNSCRHPDAVAAPVAVQHQL